MTIARTPSKIAFQTRNACPLCTSEAADSLWQGNFTDPDVVRYIDMFHYSGEWATALARSEFALLRCKACGMTWHREVIAPESVPVVYGQWADAAQAIRFEAAHTSRQSDRLGEGVQQVKLVLRLLHLLTPQEPVRLLDFGCGEGTLLKMAQLFGVKAYGIDVSDSRTEALRRSGVEVWPSLEDFVAAVGEPVDAVVLSQVLEHVADPLGLLRALHARMAPGGVLFVAVPDCSGITVPRTFDEFHKVQPIEHMNAFTPSSLRRMCERAGFRPLRRPSAVVTTHPGGVLRSTASWVWQPGSTDQFFRRS